MTYHLTPDHTRLTIKADDQERAALRLMGDDIQSDAAMHEVLESIVCNSELNWLLPEWTGDLTDAPMLGILGQLTTTPGGMLAGCWPDEQGIMRTWHHPVVERWAFMQYEARSPLEDLRDRGEVVFVGGQLK